jgi:UDP-2,4-diacetamido-2,4,6-trideoxy-beta-L-altropyranose hydrolase
MSKPVLIFRADANSQIGIGHLMRSTTLAGILTQDFTCKLFTTCTIPSLLQTAQEKFAEVHLIDQDIPEPNYFLKHSDKNKLVVLDGYHLDKPYQQMLMAHGFRIAVIDDLITEPICADLVINHCGGQEPLNYDASPHAVFGLGTSYLVVNPVFLLPFTKRRRSVSDKNCFVCFGGADPVNETLKTVQQLVNSFENIHIVVGAAYSHKAALLDFCKDKKHLHIHQAVAATVLKQIMQDCSFGVCSPSTIVYEYLSIGGVVWLKQIADNQKHVLKFLTEQGLAFELAKDDITTGKDFTDTFSQQAKFFDGRANERIKKLFKGWQLISQFSIRKASGDDMLICYGWVNDSEVRIQSFSPGVISLDHHKEWFGKKIKSENCFYYILADQCKPVAQIRFDIADGEATISYLIDQQLRNKGIGPWILSKGINSLLKEFDPQKIVGHVKKSNIASIRSFEKLAFKKTDSTVYPDSFTYTMSFNGNYN